MADGVVPGYGRVSYFHAGGIDRPLLITKEGVESVVPRETWRGQFHAGTSPPTGASRNCSIGVQTNCLLVDWRRFQPWYRGSDALIDQGQRQVRAAGRTPIRWHFAEAEAANATRNLFERAGIQGIQIVVTPP